MTSNSRTIAAFRTIIALDAVTARLSRAEAKRYDAATLIIYQAIRAGEDTRAAARAARRTPGGLPIGPFAEPAAEVAAEEVADEHIAERHGPVLTVGDLAAAYAEHARECCAVLGDLAELVAVPLGSGLAGYPAG